MTGPKRRKPMTDDGAMESERLFPIMASDVAQSERQNAISIMQRTDETPDVRPAPSRIGRMDTWNMAASQAPTMT